MTERIFYANQQVSIRPNSDTSGAFGAGDELHGIQSVGMTTTFNLSQVFELGQLALYENSENLPDVEVTLTKVLDGYPLIWDYATIDATTPTLIGRSNAKCFVGLAIFSDTTVAQGTPISVVQCSGMFVSSLTYNFPLDDPFTEEVTIVGNNKVWGNATSPGQFSSTTANTPPSTGVNRRQHLQLTASNPYDRVILPVDVAGVDPVTSGVVLANVGRARLSSITVSTDLGRDSLLELGRRGPYHRFVTFPTEVTCDIEVTSTSGDHVSATEAGVLSTPGDPVCASPGNLSNRHINIATCEGTRIYLGKLNKLSSVSYGGGDAGGGNATTTYSYSNFNDLTILHSSGCNIITSGLADGWWANRATHLGF